MLMQFKGLKKVNVQVVQNVRTVHSYKSRYKAEEVNS